MTIQDRRDSARRQLDTLITQEYVRNLPSTPGRMGCTQGDDLGLEVSWCAGWHAHRTTRAIVRMLSAKPLVASLPANLKTAAEIAHVSVGLPRKAYKLIALIVHGNWTPRHGVLPLTRREKVSPMSSHTCYPCLRSVQSGPDPDRASASRRDRGQAPALSGSAAGRSMPAGARPQAPSGPDPCPPPRWITRRSPRRPPRGPVRSRCRWTPGPPRGASARRRPGRAPGTGRRPRCPSRADPGRRR